MVSIHLVYGLAVCRLTRQLQEKTGRKGLFAGASRKHVL